MPTEHDSSVTFSCQSRYDVDVDFKCFERKVTANVFMIVISYSQIKSKQKKWISHLITNNVISN